MSDTQWRGGRRIVLAASMLLTASLAAFACGRFGAPIAAEAEPSTNAAHRIAPSVGTGSPASAPATVTWADSGKRVKLAYPADWKSKKDPDYELMLVPAATSGPGDDRRITMDVPDLPPHLPFMIQMSRVEHDYVQDLKKEHPDLQVKESSSIKFPESTAKLVWSEWHQSGSAHDDVALLIIHASGVYILDARAPDAQLTPTRAAFDSIRASIVWTKH